MVYCRCQSCGSVALDGRTPLFRGATRKQVTLKKEPTGEWFATFGIEIDSEPPEPPESPEKCVGIDVGILKYVHDTDGTAVGSPDLSD